MKVKNISGSKQYFSFGVRGAEIPDGGVHTIVEEKDISQVFGSVINYVEQGLLEVLEGPKSVQYTGNKTFAAYGVVYITQRPTDGDTITVGNTTYEFDTNGSVGDGNIAVDISDSSNTFGDLMQLRSAVSANTNGDVAIDSTATLSGENEAVIFKAKEAGPLGNTLVLEAPAFAVSGATLKNGFFGSVSVRPAIVYEVTATDIAQGRIYIATGLSAITAVIVQAKTSDDKLKTFDGEVRTLSGVITITPGDEGGGGALVEGDKLTIIASA